MGFNLTTRSTYNLRGSKEVESAIPGGPNLIVSHSEEGSPQEESGTSIFCSSDGIYEVTADVIITVGTTDPVNGRVKIDDTQVYRNISVAVSSEDPDKISFTYVGQINSGSKINVTFDANHPVGTTIQLQTNSTILVQKIIR